MKKQIWAQVEFSVLSGFLCFLRPWICLSWFLRYFGWKLVEKQVFLSKKHRPWFFGHYNGRNLDKTQDVSSVFFKGRITSSTPSVEKKKILATQALLKWVRRVGLACQTQQRLICFSTYFFYFNWCLFSLKKKKNLIIFT